jgi:hypothetical protein
MQTGFLQQKEGKSAPCFCLILFMDQRPFVNRADGSWTTFTGDQLGSLFAARILMQYKMSGKPLGRSLDPLSCIQRPIGIHLVQ